MGDARVAVNVVDAFVKARRGDEIIYHNGLLMRDRQTDQHVHVRAEYAYTKHLLGEAMLFQRRISDTKCAYLMVKL
jgi:hypothetical protein